MDEAATVARLLPDLPDGVVAAVVERGASSSRSPIEPEHGRHRGVRRTKFLDGRLAAADALDLLGAPDRSVGVGGAGEPLWPTGTVGSISHARRTTVAVVAAGSDQDRLGVDLEDDRAVRGIESYVLTERETRWLTGLGPDERRRRLLSAFSAKEAVYKAFYPRVQRFFGFHAVTLEPSPIGYVAAFTTTVDPEYPPGRRFVVRSRWVGDVVSSWTVADSG